MKTDFHYFLAYFILQAKNAKNTQNNGVVIVVRHYVVSVFMQDVDPGRRVLRPRGVLGRQNKKLVKPQ